MNPNFIYKLLSGFSNDTSSKRFLMLWIGVILWAFIHVMVFLMIKPFPTEFASNLVLYDVVLITGLAGLTVSEKIWAKKGDVSAPTTAPDQK